MAFLSVGGSAVTKHQRDGFLGLTLTESALIEQLRSTPSSRAVLRDEDGDTSQNATRWFSDQFVELFDVHYPSVFRFFDRLCGDPDLASDIAQSSFVRLFQRGSVPELPSAWLITVGLNLWRNISTTERRRALLLTADRTAQSLADPAPPPDASAVADETRQKVRTVLDGLPSREQQLVLLRAEGYRYSEIAEIMQLNPSSVGTLLARAQADFRRAYQEKFGAI